VILSPPGCAWSSGTESSCSVSTRPCVAYVVGIRRLSRRTAPSRSPGAARGGSAGDVEQQELGALGERERERHLRLLAAGQLESAAERVLLGVRAVALPEAFRVDREAADDVLHRGQLIAGLEDPELEARDVKMRACD
jgi:hypothetical protein